MDLVGGAARTRHRAPGRGLLEPALAELRLAVRLARRSGDVDRESDVRATLGSVLALAGRTAAGLEQFERAVASVADPVVAAKILVRRSSVRYLLLGQPHEALDDLARALPRLRAPASASGRRARST